MVYFVNNVEYQSGVLPLSHLTLFVLREVSSSDSWNFFTVCVYVFFRGLAPYGETCAFGVVYFRENLFGVRRRRASFSRRVEPDIRPRVGRTALSCQGGKIEG